jgi:hypothetical protein
MSLTHQVHKYKSDAATYQQPVRLLRFGSGAPGFFGRGIATFAACYVLSAGGCLQRGGKAEVSSGDSLVLGRPADDEPDLHRHCLVRTPLHLVQSPFGRNSERCRTEGKKGWLFCWRSDLTREGLTHPCHIKLVEIH